MGALSGLSGLTGISGIAGELPVSLLSAAITADGMDLRLTFSRPVTLDGSINEIYLTGNYRNLIGIDNDNSIPSAVWDVIIAPDAVSDPVTIYSDETFTLDIGLLTFIDSSGNYLDQINAFPVTNGSAVLFKPASSIFTAYIGDLRASGDLWQNAGKTVPAVADGDPVRVIEDPVSGATQTAPSDASRMILTDMGGGKWGLTSDGVDDGYDPSAGITISGGSTIALAASQDSQGNTRIIQSTTINALITLRRALNTVFVGASMRDSPIVTDADPHTVVLKKASASDWSLRLDGSTLGGITPNSNEWGTVKIGYGTGLPPHPETWEGLLYGLCVCSAELTGNDLTRIETVLGGLS